jgi:hypothetical protein
MSGQCDNVYLSSVTEKTDDGREVDSGITDERLVDQEEEVVDDNEEDFGVEQTMTKLKSKRRWKK